VAFLTWDASYSVNVKTCDAQHQKLFSLVNTLHEAMKSGQGRSVIADTVRELERYTQTHFLAEEAMMERSQYPKLNQHRLEHQKFIAQVQQFRDDLEAGGKCDSVAVMKFVKDWLANHIMQTDKMYSGHLNSHGIN
jgi:hemerythrin-like metal-binding protein